MYIAAAELIVMSCHSGSVCNFDIAHWEFPVCYCNTDLIPIGLRLANCASAYAADTSIDLLIVDSASNICYIGDQFAIIVCHPARDISYQKMCCVGRNLRPPFSRFAVCCASPISKHAETDFGQPRWLHKTRHPSPTTLLRFCAERAVRGQKLATMLCCLASHLLCL